MSDLTFVNPLENPILLPTLYRVILLYIAGFFLILFLNKLQLHNLWGTNIGKRYLSWLVIGPLYLIFILLGSYFALFFLLAVLILSIIEVKKISNLPEPYIWGLIFSSVLSIYIVTFQTQLFYSLPLIYFLIFSFISIKQNCAEKSFINSAVSLYISIWIVFSLVHFVLLKQLNDTLDNTKSLLILIGFAVPLSDIFAYVIGRSFAKIEFLDRYKIASNLSSKKSYAGALGNIMGAGIGITIMYFIIKNYLSLHHWIVVAFLIGIGGLIGDITESMFKRFYKTKDSGTMIPGHGGVLDRIDSTLRTIVILYYYFLFVMK